MEKGVDEEKKNIGTDVPTSYLYNSPIGAIERFKKQVKLINLLNEGNTEERRERREQIAKYGIDK